jgi:hypothetical protein
MSAAIRPPESQPAKLLFEFPFIWAIRWAVGCRDSADSLCWSSYTDVDGYLSSHHLKAIQQQSWPEQAGTNNEIAPLDCREMRDETYPVAIRFIVIPHKQVRNERRTF